MLLLDKKELSKPSMLLILIYSDLNKKSMSKKEILSIFGCKQFNSIFYDVVKDLIQSKIIYKSEHSFVAGKKYYKYKLNKKKAEKEYESIPIIEGHIYYVIERLESLRFIFRKKPEILKNGI